VTEGMSLLDEEDRLRSALGAVCTVRSTGREETARPETELLDDLFLTAGDDEDTEREDR
jgi:hypothetical protein